MNVPQTLRGELHGIAERFERGDKLARSADTQADFETAAANEKKRLIDLRITTLEFRRLSVPGNIRDDIDDHLPSLRRAAWHYELLREAADRRQYTRDRRTFAGMLRARLGPGAWAAARMPE